MIDFRIFQLDMEQEDTPYQKHLAVAQQTLISVAEEVNTRLDRIAAKSKINRKKLFTMDYDFGVLKDSGKEISVQDFMGWQYEEVSGRIILSGEKLHNRYFYYDDKNKCIGLIVGDYLLFEHSPKLFVFSYFDV